MHFLLEKKQRSLKLRIAYNFQNGKLPDRDSNPNFCVQSATSYH